jgi:hypothetical protein
MAVTLGFAFRADADLALGDMATAENVQSMITVANELTQVFLAHHVFSL